MKLAIVGSRTFTNYNILYDATCSILTTKVSQIISGGANGADTLAKEFAQEFDIPLVEFLPEWDKYGKSAGMIRNKHIVDSCDKLLAFWDGHSAGTKNSINLANKNNKLLNVILV